MFGLNICNSKSLNSFMFNIVFNLLLKLTVKKIVKALKALKDGSKKP